MDARFTISSRACLNTRRALHCASCTRSAGPSPSNSAPLTRRLVIALYIALCSTIFACETVVEVDAPPHDSQLVVHGFFSSDSLWMARVTHSVAYTSRSDPNAVEDADVSVTGPDGAVQVLTRRDSGLYVGIGLRPETGAEYTLRASAPGFSTTEGSAALPAWPSVSGFSAKSTTDRGGRVIDLAFTLDDPPGTANNYGVFIVQSRWQLDIRSGTVTPMIPTLFTFESEDPVFESDPELDFLGDEIRYYRDPFFNDVGFDGAIRTVELRIRFQDPSPWADTQVWRAFALVVVSTSDDLFAYWTTANRQLTTGQNPFAEPIRVHTNMSNGLGVFGAFQYRILPIPPVHLGLGAICDTTTRWRAVCDSVEAPPVFSSLPVRTGFLDGFITH